ncbi:MAG: ribose ABC transporter permease, partial [Lachnospiraceae bacterium]|nr:ribose ABC transporter permease [Lachnospiraceae bacterium]
ATAAQFSGINVKRVKIFVWTASGILASIAGIVLAARLASGQPGTSIGAETDAIAGSVLGGVSMYGGVGSAGGVLIGCLVIGVITNGLTLLHFNTNWQYVAKGVIILLACYVDMVRQNKKMGRAE